jgi:hypothetical protein
VYPKFAQKWAYLHQPRLVYSTSNARIALCRLASKVAKFALHPKKKKKKSAAALKLPPRTLSELPKFAQKLPQTHRLPLGYYTSDAHRRPVASR